MSRVGRRGLAVSGALDTIWILVFVAIGRAAHTDGVTLAGMVTTSWPFLAGAAAGWVVGRGWRQPTEIAPTGVVIWVSCVVVGMALRVVSGQGTALPFIGVALAFLGLGLLGWRTLAQLGARRARS